MIRGREFDRFGVGSENGYCSCWKRAGGTASGRSGYEVRLHRFVDSDLSHGDCELTLFSPSSLISSLSFLRPCVLPFTLSAASKPSTDADDGLVIRRFVAEGVQEESGGGGKQVRFHVAPFPLPSCLRHPADVEGRVWRFEGAWRGVARRKSVGRGDSRASTKRATLFPFFLSFRLCTMRDEERRVLNGRSERACIGRATAGFSSPPAVPPGGSEGKSERPPIRRV